MEMLLIEFELDVKAFLDSNFHLDLWVFLGLLSHDVIHDKLFLFCDAIVASIDANVDEVADSHVDPIVRLELLLNSVEGKVVCHVVSEGTWGLQFTHQLCKDRILILILKVLNDADQLNTDALMIELLLLVKVYHYLPFDVFPVL